MAVKKDEKTGKWFYYGKYTDVFGKKVQYKKRGFSGKRVAEKAEQEFLIAATKEINKTCTFEELCIKFLEYKKIRVKPRTYFDYKYFIDSCFVDFKEIRLNKFTVQFLQKWQSELMKKNHSNNYVLSQQKMLSRIFIYAVKNGYMNVNPFDKLDYVKNTNEPVKKIQFFTYEQYKGFRSVIQDEYYRLVFDTLYLTGMRISELQARKWKDIDWEDGSLTINSNYDARNKCITNSSKTGTMRIIYLNKTLKDDLRKHYDEMKLYEGFEEDRFIFGFEKPIPQQTVLNHKIKYINTYNELHKEQLPMIRLHDFRHSHVSLLINKGVDSFTISERLGHSKAMVENVYGHMFPDNKKKVLNILDNL